MGRISKSYNRGRSQKSWLLYCSFSSFKHQKKTRRGKIAVSTDMKEKLRYNSRPIIIRSFFFWCVYVCACANFSSMTQFSKSRVSAINGADTGAVLVLNPRLKANRLHDLCVCVPHASFPSLKLSHRSKISAIIAIIIPLSSA